MPEERTEPADARLAVDQHMRELMRQFGMDARFKSVDAWLDFVMGPNEQKRQ